MLFIGLFTLIWYDLVQFFLSNWMRLVHILNVYIFYGMNEIL